MWGETGGERNIPLSKHPELLKSQGGGHRPTEPDEGTRLAGLKVAPDGYVNQQPDRAEHFFNQFFATETN